MTPDEIEKALEQPEFNKPLMDLAKARIALDTALDTYEIAVNSGLTVDDSTGLLEILTNWEIDFMEDFALPFEGEETGPLPITTIQNYYDGIKARLLSPAYRLKQALENPS